MHEWANKQTVETRVVRWLCPPSHLEKRELACFLHFPALPHCSANRPTGHNPCLIREIPRDGDICPPCPWVRAPALTVTPAVFSVVRSWVWLCSGKFGNGRYFRWNLPFGLRAVDYHISSLCLEEKNAFRGKWNFYLHTSSFLIPERPIPTVVWVCVRFFPVPSAWSYFVQTVCGSSYDELSKKDGNLHTTTHVISNALF